MKLDPIVQALAALASIKNSPAGSVPHEYWLQCMYAHNVLEAALQFEHLQVVIEPVAQPRCTTPLSPAQVVDA